MHSSPSSRRCQSGKGVLTAVVAVATVLCLARLPRVQADSWYSGNRRPNAYGVSAYIYTPSSAPYIASVGSYHWVSAPPPDWVQTGWGYLSGMSEAKQYREYSIGRAYDLTWYDAQPWGTTDHYKVEYGGYSTWYAYINGVSKGGAGPIYAPAEVQSLSEVQGSTANTLDTRFSGVSYRPAETGQYIYFDQANWSQEGPYRVQQDYYYYYRTYGP